MGGGIRYPYREESKKHDKHDDNKGYRGIVDMGSNGIRFSISDLTPPRSRILPTVYQNRLDVSLYTAQYDPKTGERVPIPDDVIEQVVAALLRFQVICDEFKVAKKHIRIIATEATRTAINSEYYRKEIKNATDIEVEMLAKEEEGFVGALGVASGFSDVSGLVMDLGGGSTQITWMTSKDGHVAISPRGSVSFPYGAAALTKKLAELKEGKSEEDADKAIAAFRNEMKTNFTNAYAELKVPKEMEEQAIKEGGFPLYLSGGGFRGWGYLLLHMDQIHGRSYPISLVNGYSAPRSKFADAERLKKIAREADEIFRVSDRRRAQVPAVAFLVNVLTESLPHGIHTAHFCQGGVREGVLFRELTPAVREDDPLEVATKEYAHRTADQLSDLIMASIPTPGKRKFPESISKHVIHAFANTLYVHASMSKETASTAAMYMSSTGLLSSIHGVSHTDRALLALMLEERYEGELPPREEAYKASLQGILTPEQVWWTRYIGEVGQLICTVYPAGLVNDEHPRLGIKSEWAEGLGKSKQKEGVRIVLMCRKVKDDPKMVREALEEISGDLKKVGKRKHWIGGREGWGMSVDVDIKEVKDL